MKINGIDIKKYDAKQLTADVQQCHLVKILSRQPLAEQGI